MDVAIMTIVITCVACALAIIIPLIVIRRRNERTRQEIHALTSNALEIGPDEFFSIRKQQKDLGNFAGVYILFNKTKNMYYVGQSIRVFQRVNAHLTGHGNGDVYADYKYGCEFTIKMIALENSGCKTLNELERKTIFTYEAFSKGYNKTRGNKDKK